MSKLSPRIKSLINAPFARPNTLPATPRIRAVYERIRNEAREKNVGVPAWLTVSTAATMTMNSPESLMVLYNLATENSRDREQSVRTAELMREVGLKCIGFNGIPRTINCLGAFRSSLPTPISSHLSNQPTRLAAPENISGTISRGEQLWTSIYRPFESKLVAKLALSHPDLPVYILQHGYGALFSDPPSTCTSTSTHTSSSSPALPDKQTKAGRVLTSLIAISCLRAQTGVGPQVLSHVFGLQKAYEDGSAEAEGEVSVQGGKWLASEEGVEWALGKVDAVVEALGDGGESSFAPGARSKL